MAVSPFPPVAALATVWPAKLPRSAGARTIRVTTERAGEAAAAAVRTGREGPGDGRVGREGPGRGCPAGPEGEGLARKAEISGARSLP
jgi:hypothetical protein